MLGRKGAYKVSLILGAFSTVAPTEGGMGVSAAPGLILQGRIASTE